MVSKVKFLEREIERYTSVLLDLREQLSEAKGEEFFCCPLCNTRTKVKAVSLILKQSYTQTNAGSGSYWSFSEYQLYCPKCESRSRILSDEGKEFVESHRHVFLESFEWCPSRNQGTLEFSLEKLRDQVEWEKRRGYR